MLVLRPVKRKYSCQSFLMLWYLFDFEWNPKRQWVKYLIQRGSKMLPQLRRLRWSGDFAVALQASHLAPAVADCLHSSTTDMPLSWEHSGLHKPLYQWIEAGEESLTQVKLGFWEILILLRSSCLKAPKHIKTVRSQRNPGKVFIKAYPAHFSWKDETLPPPRLKLWLNFVWWLTEQLDVSRNTSAKFSSKLLLDLEVMVQNGLERMTIGPEKGALFSFERVVISVTKDDSLHCCWIFCLWHKVEVDEGSLFTTF